MNVKPEIRILSGVLEVRAADKGQTLRGYAARFNTMSENLGGFREQISPGAFADVLQDDVRALLNHDPNCILGRTKSGTCRIFEDDQGLGYEVDLPDTQVARDLLESIRRGDVNQSSFAFSIAPGGDSWAEDPDTGGAIRTITKIGRLFDVSAVTYPAYPDASVGMRSFELFKAEIDEKERNRRGFFERKRREAELAARRAPSQRSPAVDERATCPKCEASVPDGDQTCPQCGAVMPDTD